VTSSTATILRQLCSSSHRTDVPAEQAVNFGRAAIAPVDKGICSVLATETSGMTLRTPQDTQVRNAGDLQELWRSLMGDGGFSRQSIWLLFLTADGRPSPVLVPIDDIPSRPVPLFLDNLRYIVGELVGTHDVASVAVLLSRPGHTTMTENDRAWARALGQVSSEWPTFLAVGDSVQMFAPDDVITS